MANVDALPLEMLAAAVLAYVRACVLRPLGQLSGTALWQGPPSQTGHNALRLPSFCVSDFR